MSRTIEISIEFPATSSDLLLSHILELPAIFRPTHFNIGEDEPKIPLPDSGHLPADLRGKKSGYFLHGPKCSYDVSIAARGSIDLIGDLQVPSEEIISLFVHLAPLGPKYGYASLPEERVARNRVFHQLGPNKIEAWVGRDSDHWLPGLYWLNLITAELASRHGISLHRLAEISYKHLDLGQGQYLFQLYDNPEDWQGADLYPRLLQEFPKLFNIDTAKARLPLAKNILELMAELDRW